MSHTELLIYTDEHNIYNWLSVTYIYSTINHVKGEYTKDDDGNGKQEVHIDTMEGFGSLLSCIGVGIYQERLPFYLGFFEYLHNIRKREHLPLSAFIGLLVAT